MGAVQNRLFKCLIVRQYAPVLWVIDVKRIFEATAMRTEQFPSHIEAGMHTLKSGCGNGGGDGLPACF